VQCGAKSKVELQQKTWETAGVGDRLGSLEVGKEADIAIFTGHPFDVQTETMATIVAGQIVYRNAQIA
jgi:imidazolonepropionase-like amidohydrolase